MHKLKLRKPTEEQKHLKAWSKGKLLYSNVKLRHSFFYDFGIQIFLWMDVFAFTKQIHFLHI